MTSVIRHTDEKDRIQENDVRMDEDILFRGLLKLKKHIQYA
jgi:hypothetical protein